MVELGFKARFSDFISRVLCSPIVDAFCKHVLYMVQNMLFPIMLCWANVSLRLKEVHMHVHLGVDR